MAASWVAIAVAVVAALASVVAAVLARRSATDAHRSADGIDRRRHMVEALDHESETFQAAFDAFIRAIVNVGAETTPRETLEHLGAALAASAALRSHTRADDALRKATSEASLDMMAVFARGDRERVGAISGHLDAVEKAARTITLGMGKERRDLLAEVAERPKRR